MNLVDVLDFAQRGKHRNLVLEQRQLVGVDRSEAPVFEGREGGYIPHGFGEGFHRRHIPDAAAQISVLLQCHKSAAGIAERFRLVGGHGQYFLLAHRDLHRLARDFQQFLLFGGRERELSALVPVLLVLFLVVSHYRQSAVADHATLVSRDVA